MKNTQSATNSQHELDLLSEAQVAKLLGKSVWTLRGWHTKRIGPPKTKIGHSSYYRRPALLRWIEQREIPTTPKTGGPQWMRT